MEARLKNIPAAIWVLQSVNRCLSHLGFFMGCNVAFSIGGKRERVLKEQVMSLENSKSCHIIIRADIKQWTAGLVSMFL